MMTRRVECESKREKRYPAGTIHILVHDMKTGDGGEIRPVYRCVLQPPDRLLSVRRYTRRIILPFTTESSPNYI